MPHPVNTGAPAYPYQNIVLDVDGKVTCWYMPVAQSKGTVILFHGYGGERSGMLDKAYEFMRMGYSVFLPDFEGAGGSEGNAVTMGYKEARVVAACSNYIKAKGETNVILFGTSMGAAAIMTAIADNTAQPAAIVIECPFGSMYKTVCARFDIMNVPTFPMAGLLVFWGGVENGFWAFGHNPEQYASAIKCPTLLLHGAKDDKVSMQEINTIYANLQGKKQLKIYPNAAHENYLNKYHNEWVADVTAFMQGL